MKVVAFSMRNHHRSGLYEAEILSPLSDEELHGHLELLSNILKNIELAIVIDRSLLGEAKTRM